MKKNIYQAKGHLIDSGLFSKIVNTILDEGLDYSVEEMVIGKQPDEQSVVRFSITNNDEDSLDSILKKISPLGVYTLNNENAKFEKADKDKHAPQHFYSTTNHRTEVFVNNKWIEVKDQRMDAVIVKENETTLRCVKLRDIKKDDLILVEGESVRVYPPQIEANTGGFAFMSNDVSSERRGEIAVSKIATEINEIKKRNGKIVVVAGPVVIHTGGADYLASLIRNGYVDGFLGGNAIAVHDLESRFLNTSLGVDINTGKVTEHGHNHHMKAINIIYGQGSIKNAIDNDVLRDGVMYEIIKNNIPYCLAGSIRDDGPLPETVNDMIEAQTQYAQIIKGADMILMLSTMLHSIGTGNMTPSSTKTICVDINPAVVTKLSDRGTGQAIGVVSDVGLFLKTLSEKLNCE
ncbi:MAG: TIGR00300 family protein [Sphaerochaetaceae bacterium]|nr:TIGR00300 family protein [Sphaerochaetaceae bacterium]